MAGFCGRILLPLILLAAATLERSLISLADLLVFFVVQFTVPKNGYHLRRKCLVYWYVVVSSVFIIFAQVLFHVLWLIEGKEWSVTCTWWAKLIGFVSIQPGGSTSMPYFLALQLAAVLVSTIEIFGRRCGCNILCGILSFSVENIGSHLRVACCLLLPAVQLVVGISHPSWMSLPFFVCSCIGLVDWSLTSNFLGLFRWWRFLLTYAGVSIALLYVYQLPIMLPNIIQKIASFIGFYKSYEITDWTQGAGGISLLTFFFMLSCIRFDLYEMDSIMSTPGRSLTEQLLPSRHLFFIRESRSGVKSTNVFLKGAVYRNFSINFFTYGFPVLLLALSFWSFNFASFCAFGLLAYVGYIILAFPSLFHLYRLNGLLLVFILFWAASTYIFNVAYTFLNKNLGKEDMEIWETIGLWHYPIPGFFLLAQFCLGILVAMGNLVNNTVFLFLTDEDGLYSNSNATDDGKEETKVLIVATVAWGLRKCARAITLALIFLLATKPGLIHAIYMIFFLVYLLSHKVNQKVRQALIVLCETHFALLYMLKLNLISKTLEYDGTVFAGVLEQLGLLDRATASDFGKIAVLSCFCAIHNNGFKMLVSFSDIVQNTPYPPFGFSILKAGLSRSVLLSVYASQNASERQSPNTSSSHEKWIAAYLTAIGMKFLSGYRSYGTYIALVTILLTVYKMNPNYIAFGYLVLLLIWIIGRQLVEKTRRRLWFPLKIYTLLVFILIYSLSIFPSLETKLSEIIDLYPTLGYNPKSSLVENVWKSLAVLIVMQLYSYERRQRSYVKESVYSERSKECGAAGFVIRLLIWHCDKILFSSVFYASLSPISVIGFVYLFGLVISSTLPKASRIPSKVFLVYSGLLVIIEYAFQLFGEMVQMFPGQRHYYLSRLLGFREYDQGFWGLEFGLRGKILVIVACALQYNVFHWLENMPSSILNTGLWEEPCHLFATEAVSNAYESVNEPKTEIDSSLISLKGHAAGSSSWPSLRTQGQPPAEPCVSENSSRRYSFGSLWGISGDSQKWNKRRILALKMDRFDLQKNTLKIYLCFWMENIFNLFGLEINMIMLLVASFAVLNAVSMLYVLSLVACVLLSRDIIRKVWPAFVFIFASVLTLEYFAIWKYLLQESQNDLVKSNIRCHDCWRDSSNYFDFCKKCWLGLIVDDPRMLISYYLVFLFASFKLRSDRLGRITESHSYRQMMSQQINVAIWRDLSFDTKSLWTVFDYLRLYFYCHLLDIVLVLVLITGTLEYDILHLGYLGFALVFFRMRLDILKKRNKIFKYLRMYNFALIVLSLAYQSPFFGGFNTGKGEKMNFIYEVIGFYKYDYGFRITSRSAFVEIMIFILVSIQSYIFCSREFDYVSRYLEAEQIGAIVREQEKKAAWKTAQLQHIRKSEEGKRLRNMQVEKMKAEMHNLQSQLHKINSRPDTSDSFSQSEGTLRRRKPVLDEDYNLNNGSKKNGQYDNTYVPSDSDFGGFDHAKDVFLNSPTKKKPVSSLTVEARKISSNSSLFEITEADRISTSPSANRFQQNSKNHSKENPLISAVQLIGDGVSQVQSLGNQAVTNIVSFFNIEREESDSSERSIEDGGYDVIESQSYNSFEHLDRISSLNSSSDKIRSESASLQIKRILKHMWTQMRTNNDVVCYFCFIFVFLWNFSFMSMVYPAALFLYALCVNSGPTPLFWIVMLIYTEINILLQYLYQIIIQHGELSLHWVLLPEFGFPMHKISSSFVIGILPIFLVYVSTLLQCSITAKDGEWEIISEINFFRKTSLRQYEDIEFSWLHGLTLQMLSLLKGSMKSLYRYWNSLIYGSEAPPYFVQLSMEVDEWPEYGIQPERVESGINKLLSAIHDLKCRENILGSCRSASRVRVQSIEKSQENPKVILAVFEVVHASPVNGCPTTEWHKSFTPASDVSNEIMKGRNMGIVEEVGFPYPIVSAIGGGKRELDLYAYIFGADLTVFFLVAIFYQSVIKNKSQFLEVYQLEDQFPKEYVFILMVIFFLIVLDRVIYLCSFALGKVIFYLFNLALFTCAIMEYAWCVEPSRQRAGGFSLRAIYLTKAISLALQALQIRYGIPYKSTLYRQFLTSRASQVNYLCFRLYRALPFLYELRCVLDWSCTTTSLTMYDWLKLEDIHASLYLVKCDANLYRASHKQGEKQTRITKFCSGICLFFVLICVIWAPMLMYSSGNPTNIANPIKDVNVQIHMEGSEGKLTLYQTTLCKKTPWEELHSTQSLDPKGYLEAYAVKDIQLICCQSDATIAWLVPGVVQDMFIQKFVLEKHPKFIFTWIFLRDRPKSKEEVKYEATVEHLHPWEVEKVLNGSSDSFRLEHIYPRFFRVTGSGEVRFLEQEVNYVSGDLQLNRGNSQWWSFFDINSALGCDDLSGPMAIVVSEETPQGILGETLSKFSIWSLYLTFVLAVGRFIRLQCADLRMRIPYENLPSCDRLIAICENIYAARAEGELEVEEVLYWTLVKIYRSPHMLLEYTKPD